MRAPVSVLALTLASAAFAMTASQASPQAPATMAGPRLVSEWAMEQQTRERWIQGRRQPRFTPFVSGRRWVMVDSVRGTATSRRVHLTLDRTRFGRDSALIDVGPTGHVARLETGLAPLPPDEPGDPGSAARRYDMVHRGMEGGVALLASRLWDVVPAPPPQPPRAGLAWTDTIARDASDGPYFQSMRGMRASRIARDSSVGGRRLWIVQDSAKVSYEERFPERERTLDTAVLVSRTVAGTLRGTWLYDPELPLTWQRDDTASFSGEAVLRYPDGRMFRTPVRYERTRRWDLLDATRYAARIAELRSGRERGYGGMVMVPSPGLERRLAEGDTKARDSLLAAWQRTDDPTEAARVFGMLRMWAARDAASARRIDSVRVSARDTAYLYDLLARRAYEDAPFDTADVRAMLPFMTDPSLAWSWGLSRDELYENLAQSLTTWPRAAAGVTPVGQRVSCTVAACALLGRQWRSAREPRLRDVGLAALMSTDPAAWSDTVLALDGPAHSLLHGAAMLARGVGATWPASTRAPMPPAGSDWHAWLEWMDGRDPRYATSRSTSLVAALRRDVAPRVRFEESHATAVRFHQARTGRDVVAEWRRQYASAHSDSARLVFGSMLSGMGGLALTEPEVAAGLASREPSRVELARESLLGSFSTSATPLDTARAAPLIERLLAATVDSGSPWRAGTPDMQPPRWGQATTLHAPRRRVFVNDAGLPASVRARWSARGMLLTAMQWRDRDPREGAVFYTIRPVTTWGRFVRVELYAAERTARRPDEVPAEYASGRTYYLMKLGGEWVIVAGDEWVT